MDYLSTTIPGVMLLVPRVYRDDRGYFLETWRQDDFNKHIPNVTFIQDNESQSSYGVLRGLHYQQGEYSQAKLVRVIQGTVVDVAVDLRRSSDTFGKYVAVELSAENKHQLFIPRGFAHGFVVLSKTAIFAYKVDNVYAPAAEATILWNDHDINISWPIPTEDILLSEKDRHGTTLSNAILFT